MTTQPHHGAPDHVRRVVRFLTVPICRLDQSDGLDVTSLLDQKRIQNALREVNHAVNQSSVIASCPAANDGVMPLDTDSEHVPHASRLPEVEAS